MDRARASRRAGMTADFNEKKRTSNHEGGPRVLKGVPLVIRPLPNGTGRAMDRLTFFLFGGVVGDGPRAHSTSTLRRAGRDDRRFFFK